MGIVPALPSNRADTYRTLASNSRPLPSDRDERKVSWCWGALVDAVAAAVGAPASSATRRHARGEVSQMKRIFLHVAVEVGISIAAAAAAINVSRQRGSKLARTPLATGDRVVAASIAARLR